MRAYSQKGFSLLEIMVVLVIVAILMSLVVPNIINRPDEARITAAKIDMKSIANALNLYKLDNFSYPNTQQGLEGLVAKPAIAPIPPNWKSPYLKKLPIDPWGNPYQYLSPGTRGEFDLYSFGPGGNPSQPDTTKIIGEWDL